MLYALSHPLALLGLMIGFVVAVTLHAAAQAFVASRLGDRQPRAQGRLSVDPRRQVDPFGSMAAALAGPGWPRPVDLSTPRFRANTPWRALVALAAGPVVSFVLGVGLLVAGRAAGASPLSFTVDLSDLLHGRVPVVETLPRVLVAAGAAALAVGLISLFPLPPLDGGRALFAVAPQHGSGWQRARHWLIEQNVGLVAVLVLLILPIAGERPLLLVLLDTVARPILDQVAGL